MTLTAASKLPGATTRLSSTALIFVTRLKTDACSWGEGVNSCALFNSAWCEFRKTEDKFHHWKQLQVCSCATRVWSCAMRIWSCATWVCACAMRVCSCAMQPHLPYMWVLTSEKFLSSTGGLALGKADSHCMGDKVVVVRTQPSYAGVNVVPHPPSLIMGICGAGLVIRGAQSLQCSTALLKSISCEWLTVHSSSFDHECSDKA